MSSASDLLGYDARLLSRLPAAERDAIEWLAAGWAFSCALLAGPIGYAAWLATHSAVVAAAVGCGALALLGAVLRLTIAGGGAAPHRPAQAHDPSAGPAILIGVLALLFAQPALLPLSRAELEAPLARHRSELLERHTASARQAGSAPSAAYARELARCEFLALRLQHSWHRPARAAGYTFGYVLIVLLPSLLGRTAARAALRRYERERVRVQRRVIRRAAATAQAELAELLARYPSYEPRLAPRLDPFEVPR
ncbi:MAG TPA: hypothetical protein VJR89_23655 [Polyangiales bacterium]|nr:hypothetical protein [Polyangiales bacterium]